MALPPAYGVNGGQSGSQLRRSTSPSLDVLRHQTQGGFVPAKVASAAAPVNLVLKLSQPNYYQAGDVISGVVDLVSERLGGQDVDVGSIAITFSGRSKTTRPARESPAWRKTLQLFSEKKTLFSGPARLHAPHISTRGADYPSFAFQFTLRPDCNSTEMEEFETGPFFNSNPRQMIPPSFADENFVDKASIFYEIKCELLAPQHQGYYRHGSFFQKLGLNVYSPRILQEPSVKFTPHCTSFTHQSLDLLSPTERKFHERPLTLGQKLGIRSISTDRQPKASFTATVLIPSMAVIGQQLPLMLYVDHDARNSTVAIPPIIHFIKVQVFLRTETSICGMKHKSVQAGHDQTGWTSSAKIAGKDFYEAMPRVDHLDLRRVMNLTLDPSLFPSFRSFSVARTYSLRVACTIKCGGKSFSVGSAMTRCTFLAKDYAPHLPGYDEPPPPMMNEEEELSVDEIPPPYANYVQLEVPQQQHSVLQNRERSRSRSPRYGSGTYANWTAVFAASAASDASSAAAAAGAAAASSSAGGGGGGGGC